MDIEALVADLTLDEKALLTAGEDIMSTPAIDRLGIPKIRVTDGPNGARGPTLPGLGGPSSTCIPCGSAIGATWNPDLAGRLGALVAREALDRGCRGLLAPTVNLHRHPLAGRNFECYSEDPLLSGLLAAGYVRGVQSQGVFATVKHFVGNDAEFERATINSVIDERALRELYLLPFEIAVRQGRALAIMTSYNRLNGRWLTEQPAMLIDILRSEWGFEGLVMTDWYAVANTIESLAAGLDLEMPGPGRSLGSSVVAAVEAGEVKESDLDAAVERLLCAYERAGALAALTPVTDPDSPSPDLDLLREASAEATVLLTNDGVLPIDPTAVKNVALIGPHVAVPCIMGGGSASIATPPLTTPLKAITRLLPESTRVVYEHGCEADLSATPIGEGVLKSLEGFRAEFFAGEEFSGEVVKRQHLDSLKLAAYGSMTDNGLPDGVWSSRVSGTLTSEADGRFRISVRQSGRARVLVDGEVVIDGFAHPLPPGAVALFGWESDDLVAELDMGSGVARKIVVEYTRTDESIAGFQVGFQTADPDIPLQRAVDAAASADLAIVIVGTTARWESEGSDRPMFELPGRQAELVERVAAVNARTVVVVNAGAPVDMPWADAVAAALQCWFGGQEMGPAVADVLFGRLEPGGRLPTTIPMYLEHNPSFDNFPGENGEVRYGEGLFMGYRGYEHRRIQPRFAFGHGLGYTTFSLGDPVLSAATIGPDESFTVTVPITNTGARSGSEVVQCYVAPFAPRLQRPPKELKAFTKVWLDPGESTTVELSLDSRSFAYWDPGQPDWEQIQSRSFEMFGGASAQGRRPAGWQVDPGRYDLMIARSAEDILKTCTVEIVAQRSV